MEEYNQINEQDETKYFSTPLHRLSKNGHKRNPKNDEAGIILEETSVILLNFLVCTHDFLVRIHIRDR